MMIFLDNKQTEAGTHAACALASLQCDEASTCHANEVPHMRGVPHVIHGVRFLTGVGLCHSRCEVPHARGVPHVIRSVRFPLVHRGTIVLLFEHEHIPPAHASTSRSAIIELGLHLPSHVVSASPVNGFTC